LTGPDGSTIGILGVYEDITEAKEAEEALRKVNRSSMNCTRMQRLMSDTMPDLIWAKDTEKRFIFVNRCHL
jgi:PAS domain-containing protein